MNRLSILAVLIGSLLAFEAQAFDQPAPAEKGIVPDGPDLAQAEGQKTEGQENTASSKTEVTKTPEQKIADLEAEIETLRAALAKLTQAQKDLESLQGQVKILEGENTNLAARIKELESSKDALDRRMATLEADSATLQEELAKIPGQNGDPKEQTTAKPAFTHAAVRFHNHEGHSLRMNVNGVWHTLKPGANDVWVPHGPVHIYRYTDSEPKLFWEWKPYKSGFLMEFDVGKPAEK